MNVHVTSLTSLGDWPIAPDDDAFGDANIWMATRALKSGVFAFKQKRSERRRMSKGGLGELLRLVAGGAVGATRRAGKLFGMHIGVAGLTALIQRAVLDDPFRARGQMTLRAGHRAVLAGERKAAVSRVIEIEIGKGSEPMTSGATLDADPRGKLISVWVAMAGLALGSIQLRVEHREAKELGALLAPQLHPD